MSESKHEPLPVKGYTAQSHNSVALANEGKELEERYLRWLDKLAATRVALAADEMIGPGDNKPAFDQRFIALARTHIQTGAMFAIRSIFQPNRIALPEDENKA